MLPKIRRTLRKLPLRPSGAVLILASSIQNAHSGAGTRISALANTSSLSLVLMPLMWSGWKCEMTITSTLLGSRPAAARLAVIVPAGGGGVPPPPGCGNTHLDPAVTHREVAGHPHLSR